MKNKQYIQVYTAGAVVMLIGCDMRDDPPTTTSAELAVANTAAIEREARDLYNAVSGTRAA